MEVISPERTQIACYYYKWVASVQIEYFNGEETLNVAGKLCFTLTRLTNNLAQLKGDNATLKAETRGVAKNFSFMEFLGSLPRLYKIYLYRGQYLRKQFLWRIELSSLTPSQLNGKLIILRILGI
jgi:hypothetical protein